ncbi:MAG: carboxypeptidase regulatory-like domain-containing protein [Kofleriaceae bacterium]
MNRKAVIGLAAALAVAGIVTWWFVHDRSSKTEEVVATAGSANSTATPHPDGRRGDAPDLRRAGEVMIDDDPRGALTLEGQVIDADDHPVKGAIVALSSNPPRTATSEEDGGFSFDGLLARPYTVVARAPAGIAGPITAKLTAKSDPIVLKLRPGAKLTVTVTAAGKPIEATVELRGIDEQRELAKAGTAVFPVVAPGGYQIATWAEGMAQTLQWIQIGAGDAEAKVALVPGAPVSGRVVDERGNGVGGARVRYSGASDWSQQGNDRLDGATTTGDGSFKLAALPAGSFRFVATHAEHAPGTSALVTLDGKTAQDNITITLAAGATVKGRVVDASKQPVASARVRIGAAANRRAMIFDAPRQAYSDANGMFEIKGLPKKPLSAVALHATGSSDLVDVDASAGDVFGVTLAIDVTGTIAGIVVDPAGQPMEGVQVTAGPSFADNRAPIDFSQWRLRGFPQELTDASGKFTLAGLAAGTYTVSAAPASSRSRRGFGVGDGVTAKTGDSNVKIVLPPEGAIKGKVAFGDGSAPGAFTVSVGTVGQTFTSGGEFTLDGLPPQKYELSVRGPTFQTRALEVVVESGKTADAGTVVVVKGRTIAGLVLAEGKPVPGAEVHVGRLVFGNGTSSNAQLGPMGSGTKHETTDASGAFSLSGFPEGDITIVAEHTTLGRSRAMRLPTVLPGQTELNLTLEPFGSLSGVLRQAGKPVEGVFVTCQSTTTPGALYSVASGADGAYRFDRLAPDVYKVSATVGMPMTGMRFYSQQVAVPSGKAVTIDLVVEPGTVTLDVTVAGKGGKVGVANVYIVNTVITAKTQSELGLKMAAAGPGASQWVIVRNGEPARFSEVAAGSYSACVVPYPLEVKGMAAMGYAERHGDTLPAFCKAVVVGAAPDTQTATVPVELPPFIPDTPPTGPGSGSGSGSGG